MCSVLRVSRSGFYQWLHKPLSDRAIEDLRLLDIIRVLYAARGGVYGTQGVFWIYEKPASGVANIG